MKGWDNFALGLKYQFYQNAEREAIVSAGIDWDIGHSGSARVGAEPFSTFTPALFFGKGFGDLPEARDPAAVRVDRAARRQHSVADEHEQRQRRRRYGDRAESEQPHWGFALEYSIPYLQSYVQDMGSGRPSTGSFRSSNSISRRR